MKIKNRYCLGAALITSLAVSAAVIPSVAQACSPGFDVWHLLEEGQSLPANAGIPLGSSWSEAQLTVTVDGMPASVELAGALSGEIHDELESVKIYRIVPQPEPGQVVEATLQCDALQSRCSGRPVVSYVAGPEDHEAPEPVPGVAFDIHHFPFVEANGHTCDSSSETDADTAYYVRFTGVREPCGQVFHKVEFVDADNKTRRTIAKNRIDLKQFRFLAVTDAAVDPAMPCIRVTSFDTAGNMSEPVEVCGACRVRDDDATNSYYPPEEPSWSAADLFADDDLCTSLPVAPESEEEPGCEGFEHTDGEAGSSDDGGLDYDDGDAGCKISSESPAPWTVMLLLGLPLLRRRN